MFVVVGLFVLSGGGLKSTVFRYNGFFLFIFLFFLIFFNVKEVSYGDSFSFRLFFN